MEKISSILDVTKNRLTKSPNELIINAAGEKKSYFKGNPITTLEYGETVTFLNPEFENESNKIKEKYKISIPSEIIHACEEIKKIGGRALLVGGSVRDAVISQELNDIKLDPKDFDIEVYGIDQDTLAKVLNKIYKGKPIDTVGKAFGIYKVYLKGMSDPLDFSITRTDSKIGEGHNGFEVTGNPTMTIKDAAQRRDLTINSMAYDPLTKTLYDPYHAIEDIQSGTIRVTNPKTFIEDPLRVLRIMQFTSRLGFSVAKETKDLCHEMVVDGELDVKSWGIDNSAESVEADLIVPKKKKKNGAFTESFLTNEDYSNLPGFLVYRKGEGLKNRTLFAEKGLPSERVSEEFKKLLLKGKRPSLGLEFAREIGYIDKYFPELAVLIGCPQEQDWHPEGDVWVHTLEVLDAAAEIADREINEGRFLTQKELKEIEAIQDPDGKGLKELAKKQKVEDNKLTLMLACLSHDLAKPQKTKYKIIKGIITPEKEAALQAWIERYAGYKEINDVNRPVDEEIRKHFDIRISSPGHEEAGVVQTRIFLNRLNNSQIPQEVKNKIYPLVETHMRPHVYWEEETQKPQKSDMAKAMRHMSKKLADGGTNLYMLALVTEADQRGRRPANEGRKPLERAEVKNLEAWQGWFLNKAAELKVVEEKPKKLLTGQKLLDKLNQNSKNGKLQGGAWVGIVLDAVYADQLDGTITDETQAIESGLYYKALVDREIIEIAEKEQISTREAEVKLKRLGNFKDINGDKLALKSLNCI